MTDVVAPVRERPTIDLDQSDTDRRGLHAAGRGLLSGMRPRLASADLASSNFTWRSDRWKIVHIARRQSQQAFAMVDSLVNRTVGEICRPVAGRIFIRSGLFLLCNEQPQEWVLPIGAYRAGILDPGTRPVVCVTLGGVAAVSLECLARGFEGFEAVVPFILDHRAARHFVRDVTFAIPDPKACRDRFVGLKMVALGHVAEVLHTFEGRFGKVRDEVHAAFSHFPEMLPWTESDRFVFARNDPLPRTAMRDDENA